MSQNIKNIIEANKATYLQLVQRVRKLHRAEGHSNFLTGCIQQNVLPRFTFIDKKTITKSGLTWQQVRKRRVDHLNTTFTANTENIIHLEKKSN